MDIFKIKLVREKLDIDCSYNTKISRPSDVVDVIRKFIENFNDREIFVVVCLSTKNDIAGINIVSIGTLNGTLAHPREVFKPAILNNASDIIIAHNHPSGDIQPSNEDVKLTKRLYESGEILGIEVLDHLIIGDGYYSMKSENIF